MVQGFVGLADTDFFVWRQKNLKLSFRIKLSLISGIISFPHIIIYDFLQILYHLYFSVNE